MKLMNLNVGMWFNPRTADYWQEKYICISFKVFLGQISHLTYPSSIPTQTHPHSYPIRYVTLRSGLPRLVSPLLSFFSSLKASLCHSFSSRTVPVPPVTRIASLSDNIEDNYCHVTVFFLELFVTSSTIPQNDGSTSSHRRHQRFCIEHKRNHFLLPQRQLKTLYWSFISKVHDAKDKIVRFQEKMMHIRAGVHSVQNYDI